jgi:serine/threonine protein kinase
MKGGKEISEGYKGRTYDVYNPNDNIDFYTMFKNAKPERLVLYGLNEKIRVENQYENVLKHLENMNNHIVKKFKRGNILLGNARHNFKNEFKSIKKLSMIYKKKFSYYTSLTPIFTYHFNDITNKKMDIYGISYGYYYYIFQEKCHKTIDNIDFTQEEFNKFINDIYESLLILQQNNFLHNDIKPDNIIYCNNKYKLIDWDLAYIKYTPFKSFAKGSGGNFMFNHPIKFYNLGLSLFIFKFFFLFFKNLNYKSNKWLYELESFKIITEKSIESAEYLIEKKKTHALAKYYDMYSFATLIICLAEKNKLEYPKEFINKLLEPFNIKF